MRLHTATITALLFASLFTAPALAQEVSGTPSRSPALALESYLDQVSRSNQGIQGARLSGQGAYERSVEGTLLYSPQLFTNLQHTDDQRPTLSASFQGNRTVTNSASLGVSKLTDFGLQAKLSYNISEGTVYGANPMLIPNASLVNTGLSLELTQSLWRNGFGRGTRYLEQATEAQAKAVSFNNLYQAKVTLADAETRYWRLALARNAVEVQKQSLDRSVKIRDYNARRVRQQLVDESDLLQAEAAVRARELDLKTAFDEEREARRFFNSARGIDSDEVTENLPLPDPKAIIALGIPARAEKREDVKSAEQSMRAAVAVGESARDKQLPSLDVFGNVSLNGNEPSFNTSASNSFSTRYPYAAVGLRFSVPLDIGTTSEVRAGYAKEVQGAELTFQRRLFDQENDWQNLVEKYKEAKERLEITLRLEETQRLKLDKERIRQKQGQSTTYQVFLFEQDYLGTQLRRIQTQGLILNLLAQMKTFRGDA